MNNTDDLRTRLVPAVCTQCGAALEVDPSQEAAVCPYCNMPYIVERRFGIIVSGMQKSSMRIR